MATGHWTPAGEKYIYSAAQELAMIRNSFILLDRIGHEREKSIWQSNVNDWQDFISARKVKHVSSKSKPYYDRQLAKAKEQLLSDNSSYFSKRIPVSEHWRMYDWFRDQAVFLDIETTGLDNGAGLTVVGLYDGYECRTMVRGINLDFRALSEELSKYKMIVSFNGLSFDIPFIRRVAKVPDIPHYDLRFACQRLGLRGGLKAIERDLGIERKNSIVASLSGGDAAELWRMYRGSGDEYYLNLLIEYNEEDIVNLKEIADYAYSELKSRTLNS